MTVKLTTLLKYIVMVAALVSSCGPSYGQSLPGAGDPARQIQDIIPVNPGQRDYDLPTARPRATIKVPDNLAHIRFILKDLKIQGVTAYSAEKLKALYAPFLDKEMTVAQLYDILINLQQLYLNDGYIFTKVSIPSQSIESGSIVFKVVEGYVGEVEFEHAPKPGPVIDNAISRLENMRPLNVRKLERLVLILNSQPDLHIGAVIAPPRKADPSEGRLRIIFRDLNKEDVDYRAIITLDNMGSRYAGPFRLNTQGLFNHVLKPYDRINYQAEIAQPLSELAYAGLSYRTPLFGASGIDATVRGSVSRSRPGDNLRRLDIDGQSFSGSASISYPILLRRDRSLTASAAFDATNSRTDLLSDNLYNDRIRSVRLGGNFTFSDRFHGLNVISLIVSKGLELLGASHTGDSNLSRAAGRPDYAKANAAFSRQQLLPGNIGIMARLDSQYSNNPLLSSEEFGIGGDSIGRGYDPSEIIGDKGIGFSLEINKTFFVSDTDLSLQPYVFYDIGKIWNIDPGASNRISLASAGAGIRADFNKLWNANFLAAFPLTKMPDNPPGYTNGQSPRFLFSLSRKL